MILYKMPFVKAKKKYFFERKNVASATEKNNIEITRCAN